MPHRPVRLRAPLLAALALAACTGTDRSDPGERFAPRPAGQAATAAQPMPAPVVSIDGLGQGFTGPAGAFTVAVVPPSPGMAVGPNHVVQAVNSGLAVFDKAGVALAGPIALQGAWTSGNCFNTTSPHTPVVLHDGPADRFVYAFQEASLTRLCVAVSRSSDPTGLWFGYEFMTSFTMGDHFRLALWPDGYYFTASGGSPFEGHVCAIPRASMLAGQPATLVCLRTPGHLGLIPADLDGPLLPATGAPLPLVALNDTASLAVWKVHVDWVTPSSSALTGPVVVPVTPYARACGEVWQCIPQPGTTVLLDGLADALMPRLSYRRFADGRESLLANHTVASGGRAAIRWYELRLDALGAPSLFQEGTYSPDAEHRWLGSMAQDGSGNVALGYSLSSSTTKPSIRYAGRLAADPVGTLPRGEDSLVAGAGSQTSSQWRWGPWAVMEVDPADDCTFWFTSEYLPADGTANWRTRIASFRYDACGPYDFGLGAIPSKLSVLPGGSEKVELSTSVVAGWSGPVALAVSVIPDKVGVKAALDITSLAAGQGTSLTVDVDPATPPGNYAVVVSGTGSGLTRYAEVALEVPVPPDFSLAAAPIALTVAQGGSATSALTTAVTSGAAAAVALSASVSPAGAGVSASVSPASIIAGAGATLTVEVSASATPGPYAVTVTGSGAGNLRSAELSVTVPAPPPPATPPPSDPPKSCGGCQSDPGGPLGMIAVGLLALLRRRARG